MKKLWVILALVVLIATQLAVLSSFQPISVLAFTDSGPVTVVISKADYAHLRAKISISAVGWDSDAVLLFPNDTQITIPALSQYTFSIVMPSSGFSPGSFNFGTEGINLSDNHPIDVEVLSNRTLTQTLCSYLDFSSGRVSVFWFTVEGDAVVSIEGLGAGF